MNIRAFLHKIPVGWISVKRETAGFRSNGYFLTIPLGKIT